MASLSLSHHLQHQEAFDEPTHWDPELTSAVVKMRRERFEGAQRAAEARAKREAEEQNQQEIWKSAERKDTLIEGPNPFSKFKKGVFDYETYPKHHIER